MTQGIKFPHTNLGGQAWSRFFCHVPFSLWIAFPMQFSRSRMSGRKSTHPTLGTIRNDKGEGNTNCELGKMSCGHVHWVQMTQGMVLGSKQTGNFLTSWATFSFPRGNLLHRPCYIVTCVPVIQWFWRRKLLTPLWFSSITLPAKYDAGVATETYTYARLDSFTPWYNFTKYFRHKFPEFFRRSFINFYRQSTILYCQLKSMP